MANRELALIGGDFCIFRFLPLQNFAGSDILTKREMNQNPEENHIFALDNVDEIDDDYPNIEENGQHFVGVEIHDERREEHMIPFYPNNTGEFHEIRDEILEQLVRNAARQYQAYLETMQIIEVTLSRFCLNNKDFITIFLVSYWKSTSAKYGTNWSRCDSSRTNRANWFSSQGF